LFDGVFISTPLLFSVPQQTTPPLLILSLRTSSRQVEITWALQRGLIVVPATAYPAREVAGSAAAFGDWLEDAHRKASQAFALVHPFARRPLFCSKQLVHRVMLDPDHMASLAR
jgi:hypothetical protein